jgi:uncharacterized membrane protein (DUF106 family)
MKIKDFIAEIIIEFATIDYKTCNRLKEMIKTINEDIKDSVMRQNDFETIKAMQQQYRDLYDIEYLLSECHPSELFDKDIESLPNRKYYKNL